MEGIAHSLDSQVRTGRAGRAVSAPRTTSRRVLALAPLAALMAACGSAEERANVPRPATPINITAAVTDERVLVSPATVGSGPVVLIVSNQSRDAQEVTLETEEAEGGGDLRQTTSPINPRGTATLQVDLDTGTYRLSAGGAGIRPAALEVGEPRPSAQDKLLQP